MRRKKVYEITITGEQLNELVSAKNPIIIIHNVRADSYVEILHDLTKTEKAMMGRLIETKSFREERKR